jgi:hypothetical protein
MSAGTSLASPIACALATRRPSHLKIERFADLFGYLFRNGQEGYTMRVGGEPERGGNSHSVNPIFCQSYREQARQKAISLIFQLDTKEMES